jgi:hypothetical protein
MINEQWALVAIFGFWAWVFSSIGFIFKAFPRQQFFVSKSALVWGGGLILSFCVWLIGMLNA